MRRGQRLIMFVAVLALVASGVAACASFGASQDPAPNGETGPPTESAASEAATDGTPVDGNEVGAEDASCNATIGSVTACAAPPPTLVTTDGGTTAYVQAAGACVLETAVPAVANGTAASALLVASGQPLTTLQVTFRIWVEPAFGAGSAFIPWSLETPGNEYRVLLRMTESGAAIVYKPVGGSGLDSAHTLTVPTKQWTDMTLTFRVKNGDLNVAFMHDLNEVTFDLAGYADAGAAVVRVGALVNTTSAPTTTGARTLIEKVAISGCP